MVVLCRSRNDEEGVKFWKYIQNLVSTLGVEGMSDEEDIIDAEGNSHLGVELLLWRVPCDDAWKAIETAQRLEALYLHNSGTKSKKRVRGVEPSRVRLPSPHYRIPAALVSQDWLDKQTGNTKVLFATIMTDTPFEVQELTGDH